MKLDYILFFTLYILCEFLLLNNLNPVWQIINIPERVILSERGVMFQVISQKSLNVLFHNV